MRHSLVTGHRGHMTQSLTHIKLEDIYIRSVFCVEEDREPSSRQDPQGGQADGLSPLLPVGRVKRILGKCCCWGWFPLPDCSSAMCCPQNRRLMVEESVSFWILKKNISLFELKKTNSIQHLDYKKPANLSISFSLQQ